APAPGLAADDLVLAHRSLVASGLPIRSINLVRGCLSAVKAGRLAERAGPAAVTTLAISDVEGDDAAVIGSGPTVPSGRSRAEICRKALEAVRAARVELPAAVTRLLVDGRDRPVRAADGDFPGVAPIDYTVVASIADAVAGAQAELIRRGYDVAAGEGAAYLRGDTRDAARRITATLDKLAPGTGGKPGAAVFGGETTVTVASATAGRGGRNLDLAARVALAIRDRDGAAVAAAGTDGCDGSSRAAGAIVDGGTAMRAESGGRALEAALAAFDTEPALEAAGDLLVSGPTGTNVGDLVIALAFGR
ncbi:MAG: MOFRL family protein, partial [Candidatus Binatia bacterium]